MLFKTIRKRILKSFYHNNVQDIDVNEIMNNAMKKKNHVKNKKQNTNTLLSAWNTKNSIFQSTISL